MTHIFKNFRITSRRAEAKNPIWDETGSRTHCHHVVTVTNTETRIHTTFDFWTSLAEPEIRTEYDLMNAFRCFVDDAVSGEYSFEDFCSEFGYDEDSRKAEKAWKSCRRSAKKLNRLTSGADAYELLEDLEEYA